LTGSEGWGWALDEQQRLAREACTGVVDFSSLEEADVVHSVWWEAVAAIPPARLAGKRVLCNLDNPPSFLLTLPRFRCARQVVSCWVARGREARQQCEALGLPHHFVPYPFDTRAFFPIDRHDVTIRALRSRLGIPDGAYVIGNFHRDSEGADLTRPKVQKGADVFAEVARLLRERGHPVYVLLAGPRRHFLRARLTEYGVPHTFVGRVMDGDDLRHNVLPRLELNRLYALLDLCLVTSRWEGGPFSVAEAAAARCPIVSTPVGIALDFLEPCSLYEDIPQAVALIEQDIRERSLRATLDPQHERALRCHGPEAVREGFRALYERLADFQPFATKRLGGGCGRALRPEPGVVEAGRRLLHRLGRVPRRRRKPAVSLLAARVDPFLRALAAELRARDAAVLTDEVHAGVDLFVVSPPLPDRSLLDALADLRGPTIAHRLGFRREWGGEDRELNRRLVTVQVFASFGALRAVSREGHASADQVVIAEPAVVKGAYARAAGAARRIALAARWEDRPCGDSAAHAWLDAKLDRARFELRCVDSPEASDRMRELSEHDLFVFLSGGDEEAGLRVATEALACGLPVLYPRGSAAAEIVGLGGLAYDSEQDLLLRLETLAGHLAAVRRCIRLPTIAEAASAYVQLAQ
jgi:glycosyltransferase involved in cell wall biosynthesis